MSKYRTFTPNRRRTPQEITAIIDKDTVLEEEHIPAEDLPRWRKRNKSLQTKPIFTHQFPALLNAMYADGLEVVLYDDSYQWFAGRYRVSNISVREAWSITETQWKRLIRYIYIHGTQW
tara:strand:+ start:652 stop:1008 length:357 start_codon:yes stop_codon:yes gene_type:complete